jgi:acetylornithine/succinyldiaminopimelate/putrescine aminotransferase
LARRVTGRSQLISCINAYHGKHYGVPKRNGFEENKFSVQIPDVEFITFNNEADLDKITTKTAVSYWKLFKEELDLYNHRTIFLKVRKRCTEVGAL